MIQPINLDTQRAAKARLANKLGKNAFSIFFTVFVVLALAAFASWRINIIYLMYFSIGLALMSLMLGAYNLLELNDLKADASCSPSCSSLTGTELYNSQSQTTVNVGGAVKVPGMIFDAYWGEVVIQGSGQVGAAAGQTVNLSGAGTVVFGTQLNTGSETWSITSYQPLYSQ